MAGFGFQAVEGIRVAFGFEVVGDQDQRLPVHGFVAVALGFAGDGGCFYGLVGHGFGPAGEGHGEPAAGNLSGRVSRNYFSSIFLRSGPRENDHRLGLTSKYSALVRGKNLFAHAQIRFIHLNAKLELPFLGIDFYNFR